MERSIHKNAPSGRKGRFCVLSVPYTANLCYCQEPVQAFLSPQLTYYLISRRCLRIVEPILCRKGIFQLPVFIPSCLRTSSSQTPPAYASLFIYAPFSCTNPIFFIYEICASDEFSENLSVWILLSAIFEYKYAPTEQSRYTGVE